KKGSVHKAPSVVAPPVVQPPQAPSTVPHVQEGALAEYTPSGGVRGKITAALGSKPRIDLGLGTPPPKVQVAEKAVSDAQPEKPTRKGQKGQKDTVVAPVVVEPAAPLVASAPQTPAVPPLPEPTKTAPAMVVATPEKPAEPLAETPVADTTRLTPGLRAQLNARGPENWPEDTALTTEGREVAKEPAKPAAPKQPETREPLPPKAAEPAPPPVVIYVDEQGNTVPKPPDSPAMIAEAKKMLDSLQYQAALDLLAQIREHHLTPEQRENVLYMISEATNSLYRDNWMEGYEPVVVSTNEAMNYNLRSQRVPEALMRLGMINLNTGNQDEAAGYFGALKNKYALDPNVPLGYLALGKDQFKKGQYAEAVQSFQSILDEYPESRAVRDASRYMAEALFKQGHNSRALILVDFVDRRWPRLYLDDPEYLPMVGELQFQENRPDNALQTYWTYYNLIPDNPDNHKLLLRIGTIYLQKGLQKGSRDVLEELMRKYPQSTSAPIALQRLGEEGLYDGNPTLDQLFALFERPSNTSPDVYYRRILKEYPTSPEAELATLRLAAWTFWSKETAEAMGQAQKFIDDYPLSPYVPRAEDIIRRGFDREFALARDEENYERILRLWEQYPQVQAAHVEPTDDLRVALARGFMNRGKEKEGIDLLSVFLERPRDPDYGDYVYNLFLARALRNEDWNGVLELAEKVARWNLQPAVRAQLDYARAISSENLGLGDKALPIWRKLHDRDDIPLYQKAYATYFMARDAEHRRDLQAAYQLNMDTLKLFTQLEEERSDKADPE
ncbi:MAG: tetratricopeptide repeat protein, partial [Bilophila sp.]